MKNVGKALTFFTKKGLHTTVAPLFKIQTKELLSEEQNKIVDDIGAELEDDEKVQQFVSNLRGKLLPETEECEKESCETCADKCVEQTGSGGSKKMLFAVSLIAAAGVVAWYLKNKKEEKPEKETPEKEEGEKKVVKEEKVEQKQPQQQSPKIKEKKEKIAALLKKKKDEKKPDVAAPEKKEEKKKTLTAEELLKRPEFLVIAVASAIATLLFLAGFSMNQK